MSVRHPLRTVRREAEHLKEIADRGEGASTPAILAVTWMAIALPLIAVVIGLAFGLAYLVAGNTGTAGAPVGWEYPGVQTGGQSLPPQPARSASAGRSIYATNCSACHGPTGHGGVGPDLTTLPAARNVATVVHQVTFGGRVMPPFKGTLDQRQIEAVAAYVSGTLARGG